MNAYDVVIIGGGPAGLNGALILGRCRRRVLVCDTGKPRNSASHGMHGFLSRDGTDPHELLRLAREQLRPYETVELQQIKVTDVQQDGERFQVRLADGYTVLARKLLVATGVVDELPPIEGIEPLYGRSVFHCPYCDGWEMRDQPLAIYGKGKAGLGLALELTCWSRDLILCTNGPADLQEDDRERLRQQRIGLREEQIARLEGRDAQLTRVVFEAGESIARSGLFFSMNQSQHCNLAQRLGCQFTNGGAVQIDEHQLTCIAGVYAAGDTSRRVQQVIQAAAEGASAAVAINTELLKEDLQYDELD